MSDGKRVSLGVRGRVRIHIKPGGHRSYECIDLVGDLWQDYSDELRSAFDADAKHDIHSRNRHIRAAIKSLISHFEGVVCGLLQALIDAGVRRDRLPNMNSCIREKVLGLRGFAAKTKEIRLPYLRLRLKALRDMVVHPTTSQKNDPDNLGAILTQADLYLLTPESLQGDGRRNAEWLSGLCAAFKYPRLIDTKRRIAECSGDDWDIFRI